MDVQEKREMTNPKQVSPQEVVPEMNNPKQVSPQEIVPEVNNPKQGSPQGFVHEMNNLKQESPQGLVHEVNNPKQESPQEVVFEVNNHKQGSSQEDVPEVNNPKQGSPQEVVHEVNNPKQESPQEVMPEVNNPKQGSPQEVVPEVNNPKQGCPQEVVPEVDNPKQGSPQEVVHEVNNPKQGSPQEIVPDLNIPKQVSPQEVEPERKNTEVVVSGRKKTERPSFELRVLRALNKLIKKYPSKDHHALICNICKRGFPNANSLCAHQKTHKHDPELERKLKQVEASNSYQGTSNSVGFGGSSQYALSNGISRGSIRNMDIDEVMGYPSAPPYEKSSYGFSPGAPLVTHSYNRPNLTNLNRSGLSFGPFKPNGGSSNSNYPSLFNGGFTMAPPATPNRPFIMNPSYGSLPYYSYGPHDSINLNSIALPNILGSRNNNSSSQGAISLELSLGPSKWLGGSNNNSSAYPSLNIGGVTGGGSVDLNMPVRPLVSRHHFYSNNPLYSVTRNIPPPPSPVSSLPNDENVPGSNSLKELISKEKNKVVVLDDDGKDGVSEGHDADKPAEV
ncbi:hypothetical protein Bca101_017086 [Brassica carinata]